MAPMYMNPTLTGRRRARGDSRGATAAPAGAGAGAGVGRRVATAAQFAAELRRCRLCCVVTMWFRWANFVIEIHVHVRRWTKTARLVMIRQSFVKERNSQNERKTNRWKHQRPTQRRLPNPPGNGRGYCNGRNHGHHAHLDLLSSTRVSNSNHPVQSMNPQLSASNSAFDRNAWSRLVCLTSESIIKQCKGRESIYAWSSEHPAAAALVVGYDDRRLRQRQQRHPSSRTTAAREGITTTTTRAAQCPHGLRCRGGPQGLLVLVIAAASGVGTRGTRNPRRRRRHSRRRRRRGVAHRHPR